MTQDFDTQHQIETYKSLITISIESFKYIALVNGGAAIALVSYVTNALQKTGHVPDARLPMGFFLAGLVCCGFTMMFSYWTQLALFNESMKRKPLIPHTCTLNIATLLFIGSLFCFVGGCWYSIHLTGS
jgi:hypothetical protein